MQGALATFPRCQVRKFPDSRPLIANRLPEADAHSIRLQRSCTILLERRMYSPPRDCWLAYDGQGSGFLLRTLEMSNRNDGAEDSTAMPSTTRTMSPTRTVPSRWAGPRALQQLRWKTSKLIEIMPACRLEDHASRRLQCAPPLQLLRNILNRSTSPALVKRFSDLLFGGDNRRRGGAFISPS